MDDGERVARAYLALTDEAIRRGLTWAVPASFPPLPPPRPRRSAAEMEGERAAKTQRAQTRRWVLRMAQTLYETTVLSCEEIGLRVGRTGPAVSRMAVRFKWDRPEGYRHPGKDGRESQRIISIYEGER